MSSGAISSLLGPAVDVDPGLQLLEAVAANDVPMAKRVLERHAREHARDYQFCATLEQAQVNLNNIGINPEECTAPQSVRDLINNSRDEDGYSAMVLALDHPGEFGALPMVRFLIENGADLEKVPVRVKERIRAEAESRRISKDFKPERFPQTVLVDSIL